MNKFFKWFGIVVLTLIGLCLLAVPFLLFVGMRWAPFMSRGFRGTRMMGGFGMLGGFWMLARFILPLIVIALIVLAIIAIVRGSKAAAPRAAQAVVVNQPAPTETTAPVEATPDTNVAPVKKCAHCGSVLQSDWVNCPYCGEKI